ncbi:glycosyltransferase family 4 protein [Pedobacter nyackensis]|uniref:Glycosyltransferase involved in cell wall bisynthesis n=1 Tax=Pedobacter nyackensis TaxID=475255 RepID=A0A1W2ETF3_9SPHI|nr:glycosyltransferase family 1 protein [Pedobacter nyackensis]SMD12931.1 Glycosyltransferase involved in cell wall bisynthesis [Pedobacter nyackensis]
MRNKLRIGIEVQRLFRKKKHGMEVVALEIIKQLQQLDTYNEYIIYVREDVDKCIVETSNFKIRELRAKSYFTWEQISLPAAVRRDKLDFLHSTCNTSALWLSVPLMLTLHDIIYLEKTDFKGTAYQNFGNIYRRLIVPRIVKMSRIIVTVSNFEREAILKKLNLADGDVKVIYNAVSPKFTMAFEPEQIAEFRQCYSLPSSFILFLGNTAPKKNTVNVIKAYVEYRRRSPDGLPLVILDFDKNLVFELLEEMNAMDLQEAFLFPGYIPSEEMPQLYNSSTLFLYPSLRESFGLPILEAMACGVPVITSNTSSMPEVAADAALFVDPFDHLNITDQIDYILSQPELMTEMKAKGVKRAAKFTWKSSAEQLLEVYQELIK